MWNLKGNHQSSSGTGQLNRGIYALYRKAMIERIILVLECKFQRQKNKKFQYIILEHKDRSVDFTANNWKDKVLRESIQTFNLQINSAGDVLTWLWEFDGFMTSSQHNTKILWKLPNYSTWSYWLESNVTSIMKNLWTLRIILSRKR
jgi:hypothetical protein